MVLTRRAGGDPSHGNVAATVAMLLREIDDVDIVGNHRGLSLAHRLNALVASENAATLSAAGCAHIRFYGGAIFTLQQRRGDILVLGQAKADIVAAVHRG